jgi:hypothetical protein
MTKNIEGSSINMKRILKRLYAFDSRNKAIRNFLKKSKYERDKPKNKIAKI